MININKLQEVYPDKPISCLYCSICNKVLRCLPTDNTITDEDFNDAIDFALRVPEILNVSHYDETGYYMIFKGHKVSTQAVYYDFKVYKNRKKIIYKEIKIWKEYKDVDDLINKCIQKDKLRKEFQLQ